MEDLWNPILPCWSKLYISRGAVDHGDSLFGLVRYVPTNEWSQWTDESLYVASVYGKYLLPRRREWSGSRAMRKKEEKKIASWIHMILKHYRDGTVASNDIGIVYMSAVAIWKCLQNQLGNRRVALPSLFSHCDIRCEQWELNLKSTIQFPNVSKIFCAAEKCLIRGWSLGQSTPGRGSLPRRSR
jgi:hypothetical protein